MTIALVATRCSSGDAAPGRHYLAGGPVPRPAPPGALLLLALVAIFYNLGFFTLLAAGPFALPTYGIMQIGWTFFRLGVLLALTSVRVAPVLRGGGSEDCRRSPWCSVSSRSTWPRGGGAEARAV